MLTISNDCNISTKLFPAIAPYSPPATITITPPDDGAHDIIEKHAQTFLWKKNNYNSKDSLCSIQPRIMKCDFYRTAQT